jgi:GR25 family glycosyltransferase involved in LPS biosynthesis
MFDDIVCINLKTREDKRLHCQYLFKNVLNINVRFHIVDKHPLGGFYGCFHSHIEVIKNAFNKGYKNILIFEDDVVPTHLFGNEIVIKIKDFFRLQDWDVFYFGMLPLSYDIYDPIAFFQAPYVSKHIVKFNPLNTHAYALNRSGMSKILSTYSTFIGNEHYDIFLSKLHMKSYCVVPILFSQKFCMGSDNEIKGNSEFLKHIEKFGRRFSCRADKSNTLYKLSSIKYKYEEKKKFINAIILAIVMFILINVLILQRM